jgi:hypothetical protein
MFLFFLARAQQVSCGKITVLTSTKKKVRRVLARKSLPRTNQNSPSAFSHQIRNNSKKDKTKTSQMMCWIEKRPNKFLNQNFVRQGLPAKSESVRFRFISLICQRDTKGWVGPQYLNFKKGKQCEKTFSLSHYLIEIVQQQIKRRNQYYCLRPSQKIRKIATLETRKPQDPRHF